VSKNLLSAGAARTVINPPMGVDLCGYAGRVPGCTGIHDDLHAKALALSDGRTQAAIVSLDLVGLGGGQVAWIRGEASRRTGIPGGNVLIGASHTHAGPASQTIRACGYANDAYVEDLLSRIVWAVESALRSMRPARFGFGTAHANIAINRRYRAPSGEVQIGENAGGVTDPEVGIWHFTDQEGRPLATVFNYACHAVVMGGDNRLVSADWPGAAQRAIEAGIGRQAMFLQGCCGNINPRERGTFEAVEQTGREVAEAVLAALAVIRSSADLEMSIASETVDVPLQRPISLAEAERTVRESAETLAKDDIPLHERHLCQAYHDWAQAIISRGATAPTSVPFEVQRLSLDDAHIIGLPGEVFVEYALNLKKLRPNVMVSGYTNGNVGYVPTRKAFEDGGYEVDLAYKLYAQQMFTPDAEDVILDAGTRLLADRRSHPGPRA